MRERPGIWSARASHSARDLELLRVRARLGDALLDERLARGARELLVVRFVAAVVIALGGGGDRLRVGGGRGISGKRRTGGKQGGDRKGRNQLHGKGPLVAVLAATIGPGPLPPDGGNIICS